MSDETKPETVTRESAPAKSHKVKANVHWRDLSPGEKAEVEHSDDVVGALNTGVLSDDDD